MDAERLPNFFIIGAAKSGTTSLFELAGEHPGVFASKKKEIKFFSNDERYKNGIDWYAQNHFSDSNGFPVRMEASPAYLTWSEKVAPRIKAAYRGRPPRFAVIFRDPVKRAYSHYWDRVRQGDETLSFPEAIHAEESRIKENWDDLYYHGNGLYGYFRAGCYATRLKPYLEAFPLEQFFFLLQEDLQNHFERSMNALFNFLELDGLKSLQPVKRNQSAIPRDRGLFSMYSRIKQSKMGGSLRHLLPRSMKLFIRHKVIVRPLRYPPIENDIAAQLYSRYLGEVKQLESILGRNLSHWYSGGQG